MQTSASQPPTYQGRRQPCKPRPAPLYTVKALIEAQPEEAWQTISWREGTKGTMQAQVVAIHVHWATGWPNAPSPLSKNQDSSPAEPVPQDATAKQEAPGEAAAGETKYWFSTLPPDTSLERLVTLAHARWVIEQFYEDAKQECGLDDFQGRRWDGLHRHLALVMLAYSFLMLQRLQLPLPADEDFPPSVIRSSLPSVHRQVLLWLFQDLVLWLIQTDQIKTFRPRRN